MTESDLLKRQIQNAFNQFWGIDKIRCLEEPLKKLGDVNFYIKVKDIKSRITESFYEEMSGKRYNLSKHSIEMEKIIINELNKLEKDYYSR